MLDVFDESREKSQDAPEDLESRDKNVGPAKVPVLVLVLNFERIDSKLFF